MASRILTVPFPTFIIDFNSDKFIYCSRRVSVASIQGDISVMPLTDLLQWVDLSRKSGTLNASFHGVDKKIYLEEGKIVYVSSNKEGERLGEYIARGSFLDINKIRSALEQSQTMKMPFTQRLIDLNFFTLELLTEIMVRFAKELLLDAISWDEGWFEFIEGIVPQYVMNGPIKLNTTEIIYEVFRELEDMRMGFKKSI